MHCQLKLEFLAPRGEELHEVEQPHIPQRTLQYFGQRSFLQVSITCIRAIFDVICSAFNKRFQPILDLCAIVCDGFVILHIFKTARCTVSGQP